MEPYMTHCIRSDIVTFFLQFSNIIPIHSITSIFDTCFLCVIANYIKGSLEIILFQNRFNDRKMTLIPTIKSKYYNSVVIVIIVIHLCFPLLLLAFFVIV